MKKEAFYCDDADTYVILGCKTKKEAIKILNKLEKEDLIANEEYTSIDDLDEVNMRVYKKNGEDYYDWSGEKICKHCNRKYTDLFRAWILRI